MADIQGLIFFIVMNWATKEKITNIKDQSLDNLVNLNDNSDELRDLPHTIGTEVSEFIFSVSEYLTAEKLD